MLIVMFETVFGRSVWEFVMDRRLEHAKTMIEKDRSKPINDIAFEIGMDPKYFSDFFHARMGVAATQYRKNLK